MTKKIITISREFGSAAVLSVKKWPKNLVSLIMIRIS